MTFNPIELRDSASTRAEFLIGLDQDGAVDAPTPSIVASRRSCVIIYVYLRTFHIAGNLEQWRANVHARRFNAFYVSESRINVDQLSFQHCILQLASRSKKIDELIATVGSSNSLAFDGTCDRQRRRTTSTI